MVRIKYDVSVWSIYMEREREEDREFKSDVYIIVLKGIGKINI